MKKTLLLLTFVFVTINLIHSQELQRSVSFGAALNNISDSAKAVFKLKESEGTIIQYVLEGSSAERAGFKSGDVLISLNEIKIENTDHFISLLKVFKGGDKVNIRFYRNSLYRTTNVVLYEKAKEQSTQHDVTYSSVRSGNNHLRTIITKPKKSGVFPAVLIVGGVGCYSIDNISGSNLLATKMWVDSLTYHGFVTLRVEKTGMGDSKGIPCSECDFKTEMQGFLVGLIQLKSLGYVDKENVFIAGFSMGGVIAPLIALLEPVKGIIAYGTAGRNWFEYELENTRRQRLLENYPADSLDVWMRAEYKRLYGLFVEKKNPEQIIREHPETKLNFFSYPMSIEYFRQVSDVNSGELWKNTKAHILVMHGTSDFISSAAEHELIARTVNRYSPQKAKYIEIKNSDHWEILTESELISKARSETRINPLALQTAINWLVNFQK